MILANELDTFRNDLADTLRQYRSLTAQSIGNSSMERFADDLDTKREIYERVLSGDNAKTLTDARRAAVKALNSRIEALAALLRDLASLVQSYSKPTRPGELSGSKADLKALREGLTEVKEAIENLIGAIDEAKKALRRGARGALSSDPRGGSSRSHHREPNVAVTEVISARFM